MTAAKLISKEIKQLEERIEDLRLRLDVYKEDGAELVTKKTLQKELKTEVMKKLEDEYYYRNRLIGWLVSDDQAGEGEIRFIKPLAEQFNDGHVYLYDLLNDWMLRLQVELNEAGKRSHEHYKKVRKQKKYKQSIDD